MSYLDIALIHNYTQPFQVQFHTAQRANRRCVASQPLSNLQVKILHRHQRNAGKLRELLLGRSGGRFAATHGLVECEHDAQKHGRLHERLFNVGPGGHDAVHEQQSVVYGLLVTLVGRVDIT